MGKGEVRPPGASRNSAMAGPSVAFGARFTWPSMRPRSRCGRWRSPGAASATRRCCQACCRRSPRTSRSPRSLPTAPMTAAPAAMPSPAGAPKPLSRPGATPSFGRRTAVGRGREIKPSARSSAWAGRSGASGAAITASGRVETKMNCAKLARSEAHGARLRAPNRRAPGPRRHPRPLYRPPHPRHVARRLTPMGQGKARPSNVPCNRAWTGTFLRPPEDVIFGSFRA